MKTKVTTTFVLFALLFSLVSIKAFYIQVFNRKKLIAYSNSQIVRISKTYPRRGIIFDRDGNPLAVNVQNYNVFAIPKDMTTLRNELLKLKQIIPGSNYRNQLAAMKKRQKYTWLMRNIKLEESQVEEIKKLTNIFVEPQPSRYYPNNELLAQTLGFVGIDNEGLSGIEYYFNKELKGQEVIRKYYKDAKGRPIKFESADLEVGAQDIHLSIDTEIQAVLERSLMEGVEKHKGERGGAAVMDVETGEILAIANYPTFDPNHYGRYRTVDRKLSFVTDPFEPGSILKAFTIAAALENKVAKPDTNYFCEKGRLLVQNHYISESDNRSKYEWLSVEEILKFSSNIGTTKIAFDVTWPVLQKHLRDINLDKKTEIEIPGESRGIFEESEKVQPLRLSNISFGQGIATTAIQMLSSYAVLANGGYVVKPTLIKQSKPQKTKRILSNNTVKEVTKMLVSAVNDGTGKAAKVPHFIIAGKTSTAQKVNSNGKYEGYVSGFIGYPVNVDRKFVVYTYVEGPKENGYYGGMVAAPIFKKIVTNILYKNKDYNKMAIASSDHKNIDSITVKQAASRIVEAGRTPDFAGLDKNSALNLLEQTGLNYQFIGYGIVKKQIPSPGSPIEQNATVKLYFKMPKYD